MIGADGREIIAPNITPDESAGIGRWGEADFVRAIRQGVTPDGRALRYPMLPRPEMTAEEAGAVYAYLRTIPKIKKHVRPVVHQEASDNPAGERLYSQYGCSGCHGLKGEGTTGVPGLTHVNEHYTSEAQLRTWIEDPRLTKPDAKMPGWKGIVKEQDYAPLMAHVRSLGSGKVARTD